MPLPALRPDASVRVKITVLIAMLFATCALLGVGTDPKVAVGTVLAASVGGVQIGCRFTAPVAAPAIRCSVLVIVLIVVIALPVWGYPPTVSVGVVLSVGGCAAEAARRIAGQPHRLPRLAL